MTDTRSQTESILDIIKGVDNRSIMLPEFQRDFRWEIEQTFDLFDSLIRDIFGDQAADADEEPPHRPRRTATDHLALPSDYRAGQRRGLSDAYRAETESLEDDQLNELFDATPYARRYSDKTASGYKADQRIYRRAISRLRDLFKQEKLIAYYLLDMGVEKFCISFERSRP